MIHHSKRSTSSDLLRATGGHRGQDKLVEIAYLNENIAGTAMASSYGGQATPSGNFLPDVMTLGSTELNAGIEMGSRELKSGSWGNAGGFLES